MTTKDDIHVFIMDFLVKMVFHRNIEEELRLYCTHVRSPIDYYSTLLDLLESLQSSYIETIHCLLLSLDMTLCWTRLGAFYGSLCWNSASYVALRATPRY